MDFSHMTELADPGEPGALVTLLQVRGSSARHAGASMLVTISGRTEGSIGGGALEAAALRGARRSLAEHRSLRLTNGRPWANVARARVETGTPCGGHTEILVEYAPDAECCRIAAANLAAGRRVLAAKLLFRDPAPDSACDHVRVRTALFDSSGRCIHGDSQGIPPDDVARALGYGGALYLEERELFLEPLFPKEKLFILGAGHVGKALANAAAILDFDLYLGDDRKEALASGDLPGGVRAVLGAYPAIAEDFDFDGATYAVIATRSHQTDLECVRALLKKSCRYVGLIGSSGKIRTIRDALSAEGVDPARLAGLRAPVGIDIGAQGPEEIAVSILAEIIAVRRGKAPPARESAGKQ